ncbi:MAG: hypothetical protein OZ914_06670 [Anaerolineaceae bacterium]|nr:hypothetical protein [Anaerolineaceae bacterium]
MISFCFESIRVSSKAAVRADAAHPIRKLADGISVRVNVILFVGNLQQEIETRIIEVG